MLAATALSAGSFEGNRLLSSIHSSESIIAGIIIVNYNYFKVDN